MASPSQAATRVAPWFVPALLASFACNVLALLLPFMQLKTVLLPTKVYTMFGGVRLMWEGGLYALAVLIIAFSVLFPFAKLGAICWIWQRGHHNPSLADRVLSLVERLGKWSMLDIFLVALMIALASGQWILKATPSLGVTFFLIAVVLSMLCGAHLARSRGHTVLPLRAPVEGLVSLLCVGLLLLVPVLRVDSFWLRNEHLSLTAAVGGLAGVGAWSLTLSVVGFLILAPALQGVFQVQALRHRRAGLDATRWECLSALARHWAMLDVLALALLIFLIEGRHMVPTAVQPGCWILVATVALRYAAGLSRR